MGEDTVRLQLLGKPFVCLVCGGAEFVKMVVPVKQESAGFWGMPVRPITLTCVQCGYMHWFHPQAAPGTQGQEQGAEPVDDETH